MAIELNEIFKSLTGLTDKTFIDYYATYNNIPKYVATQHIREFTDTLKKALWNFGRVKITNFATFELNIQECSLSYAYNFKLNGKNCHFFCTVEPAPSLKYSTKKPKFLDI